MGKILCNVNHSQHPNRHTKKDWKSKSKSCFKNVFEIKIQSQTISFTNPKSFILLSCSVKTIHFQYQQHLKHFVFEFISATKFGLAGRKLSNDKKIGHIIQRIVQARNAYCLGTICTNTYNNHVT